MEGGGSPGGAPQDADEDGDDPPDDGEPPAQPEPKLGPPMMHEGQQTPVSSHTEEGVPVTGADLARQ